MCVCKYVCIYVHIHIKSPENTRSSQIPGPERGVGEDVALFTCYSGKDTKKKGGLPCRKQGVDQVDLDLGHQASKGLSALAHFPHPTPAPPNTPSSNAVLICRVKRACFLALRLSLSRAASVDMQMSEGGEAIEGWNVLFQVEASRIKKSLKEAKRDLREGEDERREPPDNGF